MSRGSDDSELAAKSRTVPVRVVNNKLVALALTAVAFVFSYYLLSFFEDLIISIGFWIATLLLLAVLCFVLAFPFAFVASLVSEKLPDFEHRGRGVMAYLCGGTMLATAPLVLSALAVWTGITDPSGGTLSTPQPGISLLIAGTAVLTAYFLVEQEEDTLDDGVGQSMADIEQERTHLEQEVSIRSDTAGHGDTDDAVDEIVVEDNQQNRVEPPVNNRNPNRTNLDSLGNDESQPGNYMTDTHFDWDQSTGVSMADVGGMEELKEQLHVDVIRPLVEDREKAEALGIQAQNILFYGPPGTGKTFIAKALATELGLPFVKISGSEIQSKWINQSAQEVKRLFDEAKMKAGQEGGALIFLDELDSVLKSRDTETGHEEDNKVVNEFLNKLEDSKEDDVVFIGATNRYDNLSEAATRKGRIDQEIEIGLPDEQARAKILKARLKNRRYRISDENIQQVAHNTEGFSAADLEGLAEDAAKNAAFERDDDTITLADIEAVDETFVQGTDPDPSVATIEEGFDTESTKNAAGGNKSADTFSSLYRILGFGDEARRMMLYDIPRDDTVWVNTIGYGDEIRSELEQVESGNVVEATVTDEGDENEYWNLLDFEINDNTVLYYINTDGYTPGPTDEFWEKRDDDSSTFTAAWRNDDNEVVYEIQVQAKEVPTEDGEVMDVYSNLQRGELLTEPLFEGSGCDYLETGANAVLVVNPAGKEYLAFYLFPDQGEKFEEVWGALYYYVN